MFQGEITIKKDGVIVQQIKNVVTVRSYNSIFVNQLTPFTSTGKRIAISTVAKTGLLDGVDNTSGANFQVQNLTGIIGLGYQLTDNPSRFTNERWIYTPRTGSDPAQVLYSGIFPFTGTSRNFQTIGLVNSIGQDTDGYSGSAISSSCFCYVSLDNPITQGANETIEITYKVTIDFSGTGTTGTGVNFPVSFQKDIEDWIFNKAGAVNPFSNLSYVRNSFCSSVTQPEGFLFLDSRSNNHSASIYNNRTFTSAGNYLSSPTTTIDAKTYKVKVTGLVDSNHKGLFSTGFLSGRSAKDYRALASTKIGALSPFQNLYSHSAVTTTPLYDQVNLTNSTFRPLFQLSSGSWSKFLPYQYTIKITADNKYRFSKRISTGYKTLEPNFSPTFWSHSFQINWLEKGGLVARVSDTEFITVDTTGLILFNLDSGLITQTVSFNNTGLRAITVKGREAFIANVNSGLQRIDLDTGVRTVLTSAACYSVCVLGSIVYATFADGLSSESNWNTRIVTTGNIEWNRVLKIVASGGSNILILYRKPSPLDTYPHYYIDNNAETIYYRVITGTGFTGELNYTLSRDNQDSEAQTPLNYIESTLWSSDLNKFLILSQNNLILLSADGLTVNTLAYGVQKNGSTILLNYPYLYSYRENNLEQCYNLATSQIESTFTIPTTGPIRLESGVESALLTLRGRNWTKITSDIYVGSTFLSEGELEQINKRVTVISPNATLGTSLAIEQEYNWDGTNWVTGTTQGKTIHTGWEALADGIEIKWEDQNPGSSVIVQPNHFYTQFVFNGLLLDGYHTVPDLKITHFFRPLSRVTLNNIFSTTTFNSKIAASDTNWLGLETDDLSYHQLTLNGNVAVLISSGSPATGQIKVFGNGVLEINSSDIGQTVAGTLLYHKKFAPTETEI